MNSSYKSFFLIQAVFMSALSAVTACHPTSSASTIKDEPARTDRCIVLWNFDDGISLTNQHDEESTLSCATKDSILSALQGATVFLQMTAMACLAIPEPTVSKIAVLTIQGVTVSTGYIAWRAKDMPCTDQSLAQKKRDELCSEIISLGLPCLNQTLGSWVSQDPPANATAENPIVMNITSLEFLFASPDPAIPQGYGGVGITLNTCVYDGQHGSVCDATASQTLPYEFKIADPSLITGPGLDGKFTIIEQGDIKYGQAKFKVSGPLGTEPLKSAFERARTFKKISN